MIDIVKNNVIKIYLTTLLIACGTSTDKNAKDPTEITDSIIINEDRPPRTYEAFTTNLRTYYENQGRAYDNDEGEGRFEAWCDENGYDDDESRDNLFTDMCDPDCDGSYLIEFDDEFPLATNTSYTSEEGKINIVLDILRKCYSTPPDNYSLSLKYCDAEPNGSIIKIPLFNNYPNYDIKHNEKPYEVDFKRLYLNRRLYFLNVVQIITQPSSTMPGFEYELEILSSFESSSRHYHNPVSVYALPTTKDTKEQIENYDIKAIFAPTFRISREENEYLNIDLQTIKFHIWAFALQAILQNIKHKPIPIYTVPEVSMWPSLEENQPIQLEKLNIESTFNEITRFTEIMRYADESSKVTVFSSQKITFCNIGIFICNITCPEDNTIIKIKLNPSIIIRDPNNRNATLNTSNPLYGIPQDFFIPLATNLFNPIEYFNAIDECLTNILPKAIINIIILHYFNPKEHTEKIEQMDQCIRRGLIKINTQMQQKQLIIKQEDEEETMKNEEYY